MAFGNRLINTGGGGGAVELLGGNISEATAVQLNGTFEDWSNSHKITSNGEYVSYINQGNQIRAKQLNTPYDINSGWGADVGILQPSGGGGWNISTPTYNIEGTSIFSITTAYGNPQISDRWTQGVYTVGGSTYNSTGNLRTGQIVGMVDLQFADAGNKLIALGTNFFAVYETSGPYSTGAITLLSSTTSPWSDGAKFQISDDGVRLFVINSAGLIREYSMSTPFDISTAAFISQLSVPIQTGAGATASVVGFSMPLTGGNFAVWNFWTTGWPLVSRIFRYTF